MRKPEQIGCYRIVHARNVTEQREYFIVYVDGQFDAVAEFPTRVAARSAVHRYRNADKRRANIFATSETRVELECDGTFAAVQYITGAAGTTRAVTLFRSDDHDECVRFLAHRKFA